MAANGSRHLERGYDSLGISSYQLVYVNLYDDYRTIASAYDTLCVVQKMTTN
jgi:hypothetical protein